MPRRRRNTIPNCPCDTCGKSYPITRMRRTIGTDFTETLCQECYYENHLTHDEVQEVFHILDDGCTEAGLKRLSEILT